jgi:hypothetical protein
MIRRTALAGRRRCERKHQAELDAWRAEDALPLISPEARARSWLARLLCPGMSEAA